MLFELLPIGYTNFTKLTICYLNFYQSGYKNYKQ
jgi:hypothetical protein